MSDVAVTWAKAQTCMSVLKGRNGKPDRSRPDRNAKQVLVHMASYADAEGTAWVLVDVLALEMDVSDRMVERGRKALVEAGLLIRTGETKLHKGRVVPIYRLPVETGHASTIRRIHAERAEALARGDTGDTPSDGAGRHPCHPTPDAGVTPRGDTGDTQIGKGITQDETQGVRASASAVDQAWSEGFAEACAAWAGKAPERVSPARSWTAWVAALDRSGLAEADLLRAVEAAVARDPDFSRGKAMNLDRWLTEDRYRSWLAQDGRRSRPVTPGRWDGPDDVRAAVEGVMGPDQRASYFEPARWDGARRAIVTRTGMAAERLRQSAGRALRALNVSIECEAGRHGQG